MQWSNVIRSLSYVVRSPPSSCSVCRIDENAAGVHHADLAALGELGEAAGKGVDDLFLAGTETIDLHPRLGEVDAPVGHFARFADHLGDVQQGLRRNAAPQQAGAAQPRIGFDDRDFEPQVGGQESGGVSARPTTEYHNLRVHRHKETFIRSQVRARREPAHSSAKFANFLRGK